MYLTTDMGGVQLFSVVGSEAYAQKLLQIGEGRLESDLGGTVLFTHQFRHVVDLKDEQVL